MSLLTVENVTFGFGEKIILNNASFRLLKGEKIGLIGANGEGKSTFINLLLGKNVPDQGKITWAKRLKVGYLDQFSSLEEGKTIKDVLKEAFKDKMELEQEIMKCYEKMADADENTINLLLEDIGEMQSILDHSGFYLIDTKIEEVASGLGLLEIGLDKDVSELSGGQRAKVLLTKLLLENPQILILDEPTNFLDENHIYWLKNYLLNYESSFILISHDLTFLDSVVNIIYHLKDGILSRYVGNYAKFTEYYEIQKRQLEAKYNAQQKEIKDLEDFIARNKARVATRNMANSRQKRLDKMDIIELGKEKIKPTFVFKFGTPTGKLALRTKDLVIGYDSPLSKPINLEVLKGEKLIIKGINGIGKTTLLKSLIGQIKPIEGEVATSPNAVIGYFEQEVKEERKTALEEIWDTFPNLANNEVRKHLALCGLSRDHIETLMIALSGGEAAKVRLCKLTIQKSNILVLDEPTNHLDQLAKDSLLEAINNYPGTVLLVCHEKEFYEQINGRILDLEKYTLKIV